jgi:hypothetical protein
MKRHVEKNSLLSTKKGNLMMTAKELLSSSEKPQASQNKTTPLKG